MPQAPARLSDRLFAGIFRLLPTRALSHLAFELSEIRVVWLKNVFIRAFLRAYPAIDMGEAAEPEPTRYACFNDFFTRELAAGVRPLPADTRALLSPVDGQLGQFGALHEGELCQTKGIAYDLKTLVGHDEDRAAAFLGGHYLTLYLAPHNYHRVHMPLAGQLRATRYVPGRLFGVNPRCVRSLPRFFTRNERLISFFETQAGPLAMVMIGAFIVGGIQTTAAGRICPPHRKAPRHDEYRSDASCHTYRLGQQMGHFLLGSSVIVLTGPDVLTLVPELQTGQDVRLHQVLGRIAP